MKTTLNRTLHKLDIPLSCFIFTTMEAKKTLLKHSSLLLRCSSNLDLDCFHNRSTNTGGFNLRWALQAPHCSRWVISPTPHLSAQGSDRPSFSTLSEGGLVFYHFLEHMPKKAELCSRMYLMHLEYCLSHSSYLE